MTTASDREPLRPSEAVYRHIEGLRANVAQETRLPTVREMARRLGVGPSTVSIVYRALAERGLIRTEVGNGSFLLPSPTASKAGAARPGLQIGIGLGRHDLDDPQGWLSRIYGGLTVGALRIGHPATLVPLYIDAPSSQEQLEALDAVVILPGHWLHEPLIKTAQAAKIPVVYFNPPQTGATSNFVSPDYTAISEALGRAFRAAGRKQVLVLLSDPWHQMVSAHYRLGGLLSGLEYGANEIKFRVAVAGNYWVEDGRRAIARLLDEGGGRPDAIYASGDFLAMGCVEELEARGIRVPEEVSVVGGSGLNLEKYSHPQLTCTAQPYEEVGAELVRMILRLREAPGRPEPGVTVPMTWVGGATTNEKENRSLFRQEMC